MKSNVGTVRGDERGALDRRSAGGRCLPVMHRAH
jgi:hypothetical protein